MRPLYDCPDVVVGLSGQRCRVVGATHSVSEKKAAIGGEREGLVYEMFLTKLPQAAFTAADIVALYLHRGAFETTLSDEDNEQDEGLVGGVTAPVERRAWQIVSQWVWNLRLELGHQLQPDPVRLPLFAPALGPTELYTTPASGYAPPLVGSRWKAERFWGEDFSLQPDGTLPCPAKQRLVAGRPTQRS